MRLHFLGSCRNHDTNVLPPAKKSENWPPGGASRLSYSAGLTVLVYPPVSHFPWRKRSHYICQALRLLNRSQKQPVSSARISLAGDRAFPGISLRESGLSPSLGPDGITGGVRLWGRPTPPGSRKEPLPEVEADAAAVYRRGIYSDCRRLRGKTTPTINREEEQEDRGAFVSSRRENRKTSASERDSYFSSWGRYFCFLTCSCRGRCVRNASFRSNKSSRSAASLGGRKEIPATGGSEQRP